MRRFLFFHPPSVYFLVFCSSLQVSVFSVFQDSIVVEVPPYNKKTADPVQVQFYVSNGKKRRSLTQSFTYLPGVGRHLPAAAGVKQERWETDHISHNPPGCCPASCQVPSHDRVLGPDVVYYDSCDIPVHCGPPSQNLPHLHHPPPSSVSLQASLMFPHTSSIPLHTSSSIPTQTSSVPHQTLIPLQTFTIPPQTSSLPPQTSSIPPQTSIMPLASSVPLQTFTIPSPTSSGGPQREPSPSLSSRRTFVTPADPQKESSLSSPGEALSIKQEPEDQPNLASLGLQEITLDDGRKLGAFSNYQSCCGLERWLRTFFSWRAVSVDSQQLQNSKTSIETLV